MNSKHAPWFVLIAGSLWGTTGTVAYFIGSSVSPLAIGAVTMGGGGLILFALSVRHSLRVWRDNSVRPWVISGALGVAIYPLAFYTGMDLAGVAVGNILTLGTGPLVGAALEWAVDKRRPRFTWWLAIAVGVSGVVALSGAEHSRTTANPELFTLGVAVALLAGVSYGVFSYAMGAIIDHGHTAQGSAGAVFGAGALPLIAVALVFAPQLSSAGQAWWGLGYLVALPMVVAYLLYSRALHHLLSSTVLTIALVEPAVASVLAVSIVGERFDTAGWIGLCLIVIAVVLASRAKTSRNTRSST